MLTLFRFRVGNFFPHGANGIQFSVNRSGGAAEFVSDFLIVESRHSHQRNFPIVVIRESLQEFAASYLEFDQLGWILGALDILGEIVQSLLFQSRLTEGLLAASLLPIKELCLVGSFPGGNDDGQLPELIPIGDFVKSAVLEPVDQGKHGGAGDIFSIHQALMTLVDLLACKFAQTLEEAVPKQLRRFFVQVTGLGNGFRN